jgi:hypothetical protein
MVIGTKGQNAGRPIVLQRRGEVRALYVYKPSVPIAPRLAFVSTGRFVARRDFSRNFRAAFIQALKTAKV